MILREGTLPEGSGSSPGMTSLRDSTFAILGSACFAGEPACAHRHRRSGLAAGLVLLLMLGPLLACNSSGSETSLRPPLVLLISIDTLRPDVLGSYGSQRPNSPHLDEFARDSVRFRRAYAPSPWTIPSHASLMTSLEPDAVGAHAAEPVPDAALTLPEVFAEQGFATGAVVNTIYLDRKYGFDQGFDEFEHHLGRKDAPESIARALDFLLQHGGRPRFFFLHLFDVHAPYLHPPPYDAPPESDTGQPDEDILFLRRVHYHDHLPSLSEVASVAALRARYEAGVNRVDDLLGGLFDALRDLGLYDDALILITSDHGEAFFERRVWVGHGLFLHESELRIPMFLKLPSRRDLEGTVVETPVSLLDVAPTLLDALGLEIPDRFEGHSLIPLVEDPAIAPRFRRPIRATSSNTGGTSSLHDGRWKYIQPLALAEAEVIERHLKPEPEVRSDLADRISGGARLYDLHRDPEEKINLISEHPEIARGLARALDEHHQAAARRRAQLRRGEGGVILTPDEKARLRALGYGD